MRSLSVGSGNMPAMLRCSVRLSAVLPVLLVTLLAQPALGQNDFRLDDSDNWQAVGGVDPNSPAGALARARELLAEGQADTAYNMVVRWLERNGETTLTPDAYLLKGDALVAMGDYYEALYDYEYVIRRYPASPTFTLALARELEIASLYANGMRRKIFGLRIGSGVDEAEEIFIRIQERSPGSQLAEQAGIELADMYFRQRRMELAADMYAIFIEKYPRSPFVEKSQRRLIYANIATFKGPQFDIVGLREAKRELQDLIAMRPAEAERIGAQALINRITESEATKILTTAQWYNRVGDPIAAEFYIRNLVERFPRSAATVRALQQIPGILEQLPLTVLQSAPDYELLRQSILFRDRNTASAEDGTDGTYYDEFGQPIENPMPTPSQPSEQPMQSGEEPIPGERAAEEMVEQRRALSQPTLLPAGEPVPPNASDVPAPPEEMEP
ncbi:MAG: hypothetical protein CMJ39_07270 [Phycisphaerae bacterium]|nr:hypothetical protein [Phycisphaerae bacterium]